MELRHHCKGCRIETWKLILVVAAITTVGAILQSCAIPYPLIIRSLPPPYKALNHTIQIEGSLPQAKFEQFTPVSIIAPVIGKADRIRLNSDLLAATPISAPDDHMLDASQKGKESKYDVYSHPERVNRNNRTQERFKSPKITPAPPQIVPIPNRHTGSSRLEKAIGSLSPDQALLYAKKEIRNAPTVTGDPDLYSPIFRNVSMFRRSYELMERLLKVYIYPDGKKPIFHQPPLKGIYASEGWFMKLMEENKQFVVRDPNRAHLFYLPYSSRELEIALYVPGSHNMRPLSLFLKDYVNMISAKYPFWNRTRGSDHFLVACHDWGPYTTKEHDELCKNTIKALCNADLSEGFFVPGKDVSLPETTIRTPKRPLRDIGGRPVSQRSILAFFAGNMHGRVRPTLLEHWGDKDEDMRIYGPLPNRVSRKMSYIQHMKSSKFCICPMGFEVNSPRIVEAIYYECVPVIIADNFVLPFDQVLDWSAFSVIVAEKDIPKLKEILLAIPLRRYISMQTTVKRLQKHFLWHKKPIKYDIFHMILHSIWFNRLNQIRIEH